MKTLTKEKIIEILGKYHNWLDNEFEHPVYNRRYIDDFASELTAESAPESDQSKLISKYKEALIKIANPLKWMQDHLKEGETINGMMAIRLCGDANYLSNIAKEVLESDIAELKTPKQ